MPLPKNKRIIILGGGTNTYVSNHFAMSAPAYGGTARQLEQKFKEHPENKMDVDLILTKMANPLNRFAPDSPEDVEQLVDELIVDPSVRVIIFNVAMVDYKPVQLQEWRTTDQTLGETRQSFGKYAERLSTRGTPSITLEMTPYHKVIQKIRKERKDILLVGFKTTCGADKQEQFTKGLKLCKEASANIVFVNDVDKVRMQKLADALSHMQYLEGKLHSPSTDIVYHLHLEDTIKKQKQVILELQNNGLVTPEESSYWYNTRNSALDALVQMVLDRSHLHFTRSTVIESETIPWSSKEIPNALRETVDYCVAQGAYKTFTIGDSQGTKGSVGHFAYKINSTTFLTSKRKSNFNELDRIGLVKVVTDGPDHIYAYGAKPSVGGQSQRIIFDMYPELDCILHFHSPLRQEYRDEFSIKSQFEVECGSHECGQNTAQGLSEYTLNNDQKVYAVHLDHHGPNIVFSKDSDPKQIIEFINKYWDLTRKTDGISQENL